MIHQLTLLVEDQFVDVYLLIVFDSVTYILWCIFIDNNNINNTSILYSALINLTCSKELYTENWIKTRSGSYNVETIYIYIYIYIYTLGDRSYN